MNYLWRKILNCNLSFPSFSVGGYQVVDLARRHRQPNYRELSTFYFSDIFCLVTIETTDTFEWNKQKMSLIWNTDLGIHIRTLYLLCQWIDATHRQLRFALADNGLGSWMSKANWWRHTWRLRAALQRVRSRSMMAVLCGSHIANLMAQISQSENLDSGCYWSSMDSLTL